MYWIWVIIVGAIVGALGRLFHPGVDPMGWILTILVGIASLVIANIIFNGALVFIVGVIVAVILVALIGRLYGGRRGTPARI
jgi:uncharacterized membrane protein YeaQ/YmgE (transglycosylase-associated protein family)